MHDVLDIVKHHLAVLAGLVPSINTFKMEQATALSSLQLVELSIGTQLNSRRAHGGLHGNFVYHFVSVRFQSSKHAHKPSGVKRRDVGVIQGMLDEQRTVGSRKHGVGVEAGLKEVQQKVLKFGNGSEGLFEGPQRGTPSIG